MDAGLQAVSDYIRKFVITAFNLQYGLNTLWSDYEIVDIPPRWGRHCAFELTNIDVNLNFQIHIHTNIGPENTLEEFWLLDEENIGTGPLEKVYVAYATFSEDILFLNNNYIRRECPSFPSPESQLNVIIDESYTTAILSQEGDYIRYEEATAV